MKNRIYCDVRWSTKAEGGRTAPPPGPQYAALVHPPQLPSALFSVVLRNPEAVSELEWRRAELCFLFPANVTWQITLGMELVVTEGITQVGRAMIVDIETNSPQGPS
jgi:hypothetical protein